MQSTLRDAANTAFGLSSVLDHFCKEEPEASSPEWKALLILSKRNAQHIALLAAHAQSLGFQPALDDPLLDQGTLPQEYEAALWEALRE